MQSRSKTWMFGGVALMVCGVLSILDQSLLGSAGGGVALGIVADIAWAAGVMVFAIGFSREGSVVSRRPLGVVAMCVVALWPLVVTTVSTVIAASNAGPDVRFLVWGYASILITFTASLIASVEVVRSGAVPTPWAWAPLVALGVQTVVWLFPQLVVAGGGSADPAMFVGLSNGLGMLGIVATTFGLGIVATVLAIRNNSAVVEISTSESTDAAPTL